MIGKRVAPPDPVPVSGRGGRAEESIWIFGGSALAFLGGDQAENKGRLFENVIYRTLRRKEAEIFYYDDRVEIKGKKIVISNFFKWIKKGN